MPQKCPGDYMKNQTTGYIQSENDSLESNYDSKNDNNKDDDYSIENN